MERSICTVSQETMSQARSTTAMVASPPIHCRLCPCGPKYLQPLCGPVGPEGSEQ